MSKEEREAREAYVAGVVEKAREEHERLFGPIPTRVERISTPTKREFLKYVRSNTPVIITDAAKHWPAVRRWSLDYMERKLGARKVPVNLMPSEAGSGTAVKSLHVDPERRKMEFRDFAQVLRDQRDGSVDFRSEDVVHYVSGNNGNFIDYFAKLADDIEVGGFDWTEGMPLHEVNLWMGGEGCFSPIHNDYKDNVFVVLQGTKRFYLWHPLDASYTYTTDFERAHYKQDPKTGEWTFRVVRPRDFQTWCAVTTKDPDYDRFPLWRKAQRYEVEVRAGEALFLPQYWFHEVMQDVDDDGKVVACNFWYYPYDGFYDFVTVYDQLEDLSEALLGEKFDFGPERPHSDSSSIEDTTSSDSAVDSIRRRVTRESRRLRNEAIRRGQRRREHASASAADAGHPESWRVEPASRGKRSGGDRRERKRRRRDPSPAARSSKRAHKGGAGGTGKGRGHESTRHHRRRGQTESDSSSASSGSSSQSRPRHHRRRR